MAWFDDTNYSEPGTTEAIFAPPGAVPSKTQVFAPAPHPSTGAAQQSWFDQANYGDSAANDAAATTVRSLPAAGLRAGIDLLGSATATVAGETLRSAPGIIAKMADPFGTTGYALKAAGLPQPDDWYPTKRQLMVKYKNDPAGFEAEWNGPKYAAFRDAEMLANRATSRFEHLTPGGEFASQLQYDSMSPDKGFLPNIVKRPGAVADKVMGDAATMIPSVLATVGSIAASKNPAVGAAVSATLEGGIEGIAQKQQVRQELEAAPIDKWEKVPTYLGYIKAGYHPTMARRMSIEELSQDAAVKTGAATAAVAALGGAIFGHGAASGGAGPLRRAAVGFGTQGTEEVVQEGAGQYIQNQAAIKSIDPQRDPMEGVLNNAIGGGVVGGLVGGGSNLVVGQRRLASTTGILTATGGFNVGNIRAGGVDAGFKSYASPQAAVAATIQNAASYPAAFNNGQAMPLWDDTIDLAKLRSKDPGEVAKAGRTIAGRWAPMGDGANNPAQWAAVVAKTMGIGVNTPVNLADPAIGAGFAQGVHTIEHGPRALYDPAAYAAGAQMAASGVPVTAIPPSAARTADAIAAHIATTTGLNQRDDFLEADKAIVVDTKAAADGKRIIETEGKPVDNQQTVQAVQDDSGNTQQAGSTSRPSAVDPFTGIKPKHLGQEIIFPDAASKALYLHGMTGRTNPEFAKFLTDEHGLSVDEIEKLSKLAVAHIRQQQATAGAPSKPASGSLADITASAGTTTGLTNKYGLPKPVVGPTLEQELGQPSGTQADVGRSRFREGSASNYPNPNNTIPLLDRTIMFGENQGRQLREAEVKPGVITVAEPSIHHPYPLARAAHDTTAKLAAKYVPGIRLLLTHRSPLGQTLASMKNWRNGFYQINLPYGIKLGLEGYEPGTSKYNKMVQSQIPWSTTHELGHVIVDAKFFEGIPQTIQRKIDTESKGVGLVSEATIAQFPPMQQAVIREFNELKQRFMSDPKAKAADFIKAWMSPWKVGFGVGQTRNAGPNHFALEQGKRGDQLSAAEYMARVDQGTDVLSFHEYMAEQFARHVYAKNKLKGTAFGQFFTRILADLQKLFKDLKIDGVVKPGEEFSKWIEGVARVRTKNSPEAIGFRQSRGDVIRQDPVYNDTFENASQDGYYPAMPQTHADLVATRDLINHLHIDHLSVEVLNEANELLGVGQVEAARELVEVHMAQPTILTWDGEPTRYDSLRTTFAHLDNIPSTRGPLRRFLGSGLRRLGDLAWQTTDLRQRAAAFPDNEGINIIDKTLTSYRSYFGKLQTEAMPIIARWSKLSSFWGGTKRADALSTALLAELDGGINLPTLVVDQNGLYKWEASAAFVTHVQKYGLDQFTSQLYLDIKTQYTRHMMALAKNRRGMLDRKINELTQLGDAASLKKTAYYQNKKKLLAEDFDKALQVPFLPQTRIGPYQVEVSDAGQIIHVEGFETVEQRAEAAAKLRKAPAAAGFTIRETNVTTTEALLRVLPLEALNGDMSVKLTAKQRAQLYKTAGAITADPKTRKYSVPLGKITGHTDSTMKAFADFIHHDSLVLSKLEHRDFFHDGLKKIEADIQMSRGLGDSARQQKLETSLTFAQGYVQQIMNPAAEFHALRSFVVLKDLAFNVKSAVANLTGLVNSWSQLTTRQGLLQGSYTFTRTQANVIADSIARAAQKVSGAPVRGWEAMYTPEERLAMKHATDMGLFYEGHSAQLAGYGQTGVLERMNLGPVARRVDQVARVGMAPFQLIDEYTRQITYLGAFRAYRQQGLDTVAAYNAAIRDTNLLQGDNSIHNRAPIMRGKKSLGLIYFNYMRGMTWMFSGGYARQRSKAEALGNLPQSKGWVNETVKLWAAYALLGGVMGLPGAEDLEKLVELASRQLFGTRFSLREHAYSLAHEITQATGGLGVGATPRSLVHGFMSDIFGADVSSSIGVGNMLPGAGGLSQLGGRDAEKFWLELLGPFGRMLEQSLAVFDESLPWEKRYAVAIPSAVQNIIKAVDKDPRAKSGARVNIDPETGRIMDLSTGQLIAQSMGFTQTAIAENKELSWMQNSYAAYWTTKRGILMSQVWEAKLQGDASDQARAYRALKEFNEEAPRGLAITAQQLHASMKTHQARMSAEEQGIARQKAMRPAFQQMRNSFELPSRQ